MNVSRDKIVKYCEDYLKVNDFEDYCVNGLQVEGSEKIDGIITGVSLSQKLIEKAIEKKAKMIIVHHGVFQNMVPSPLKLGGIMKKRLKMLLAHDINLVGFHLPLDAHPEIGNNICLAKDLKLNKTESIGVGIIGELKNEEKIGSFIEKLNNLLNTESYSIKAGPKKVKKVCIVSGRSGDYEKAKMAGADTFITGEVNEEFVRGVEEVGINFIASGHYNTEKVGVEKLGEKIEKMFNIKVEFVDVPCDV